MRAEANQMKSPFHTINKHSKQLSLSALVSGKQTSTNARLNSILNSQNDFEKVFRKTKEQFDNKREFFKFYKKNTKMNASYLENAWIARRKSENKRYSITNNNNTIYEEIEENLPKNNFHSVTKSRQKMRPETQIAIHKDKKSPLKEEENKGGLIDFEEIWHNTQLSRIHNSTEDISKTFNVERIIALVFL